MQKKANMKKLIGLAWTLALVLAFCACGSKPAATADESIQPVPVVSSGKGAPGAGGISPDQGDPGETELYARTHGEWAVDGDAQAAIISMEGTGAIAAFYADGAKEFGGYLEYVSEDGEDDKYDVYNDANEYLLTICFDSVTRFHVEGEGTVYLKLGSLPPGFVYADDNNANSERPSGSMEPEQAAYILYEEALSNIIESGDYSEDNPVIVNNLYSDDVGYMFEVSACPDDLFEVQYQGGVTQIITGYGSRVWTPGIYTEDDAADAGYEMQLCLTLDTGSLSGNITYSLESGLDGVPYGAEEVAKLVPQWNSGTTVSDIDVQPDEALGAKFTFPVWRVGYTTGENEDTDANVDIYIQTDTGDYRFHASVDGEAYDGFLDDYDYKAEIERCIQSLSFVTKEAFGSEAEYLTISCFQRIHEDLPVFAFQAEVSSFTDEIFGITILDGGDEVQGTIIPSDFTTDGGNPPYMTGDLGAGLIIEDMNFDGYADMRMVDFLPAGPNVPYVCFVWDTGFGQYAYDAALSSIPALKVDYENELIWTQLRDSATAYHTEYYRYIDGVLTAVGDLAVAGAGETSVVPESGFAKWEETYAVILAEMRGSTDEYRFKWAEHTGIDTRDVFYSFCDIDGNGTAELVFLDATKNVLDLYTITPELTVDLGYSDDEIPTGDFNDVKIYSSGEISVCWEVHAGAFPTAEDIFRISVGRRLERVMNAWQKQERGSSAAGDNEDFDTGYTPKGRVINGELVTKKLL
ncbi:MAG: hypothetical protein LBR77_05415 [Lachnospiraceae bacterium]|jgi:hypothetical protein|nr:hypothetical protein [Lachnospiraceae bacterium]